MGSIQEGKWLKEHRRRQRLCSQQVDFVAGWIREEQPDEHIAEDDSDFVNVLWRAASRSRMSGLLGRPPTTISAWRSTRCLVDVIDAALCRVR